MSAACLTTTEFLTLTGTEFVSFGPASTGNITVASVGAPGDTLTLGGVVLTAVAGARTPGSDDFSLASATAAGVAQSIADAIADPLNSLTAILTASLRTPGLAIVDLVSVLTGPYSLLPIETDAALVYVLSDVTLTGGDEQLNEIVSCSCQMLDPTCWGAKRSCAHHYLAAHFITVAEGGSGGTVASKSIDKISISMAVATPTDTDFSTTEWGRMYLALKRSIVQFGAVAGNSGRVGVVC